MTDKPPTPEKIMMLNQMVRCLRIWAARAGENILQGGGKPEFKLTIEAPNSLAAGRLLSQLMSDLDQEQAMSLLPIRLELDRPFQLGGVLVEIKGRR